MTGSRSFDQTKSKHQDPVALSSQSPLASLQGGQPLRHVSDVAPTCPGNLTTRLFTQLHLALLQSKDELYRSPS